MTNGYTKRYRIAVAFMKYNFTRVSIMCHSFAAMTNNTNISKKSNAKSLNKSGRPDWSTWLLISFLVNSDNVNGGWYGI